MSMRIEVSFEQPLDGSQRLACSIAIAGLAKSQRLRFASGDSAVWIYGEAMSGTRVREVLLEHGLPLRAVHSSLDDEIEHELDDLDEGTTRERMRPIGR
jgi:hypothetical protein